METAVALVASIYLAQSQAVSPALALMLALVPLAATLIGVILPRWVPVSRLRLLPTAVALNLIGLLILSVTARSFAQLQCFWSFVSLGAYCAVVLWASSQDRLRRLAPPLFVVALGLVVLTLFIGVSPSGGPQKQWLPVGPYYFEPSELLKLSLTLLLALSLAGQAPSRRNPWSLAAIGASLAALAVQGDLGAAFVVAGVGALMLYAGTGHWKRLALGAAVLVAAGAAAYLLVPYARPRFNTWLDPWSDPTGASYQVVQSVRALATGGALGRG
ncbi:MAG: FtsW/RodA/SpoVE family cell cycle protein, partial [Anaerolineae bacterium]